MKVVLIVTIVVCGLKTGNMHLMFENGNSDNAIFIVGVVNQSVDQPSVGYVMGMGTEWLILVPSTGFLQTTKEDWRDLGVARDVLTNSSHPP